jgi:serine protease
MAIAPCSTMLRITHSRTSRMRAARARALFFVAAATVVVASAQAHATGAVDDGIAAHGWPRAHVPGVALVKLRDVDMHRLRLPRKDDVKARTVLDDIASRTGVRLTFEKRAPTGYGLFRMRHADPARAREVPDEGVTTLMIERLTRDPAVARASVDGWARVSAVPNDPYYGNMWHLQIVNAATAWDVTTGLASQRVGVVDTGLVRNHQDLFAKDVTGYDFISTNGVAADGDGVDAEYADPGDAGDCGFGFQSSSWHGTHVSGTMVAVANNSAGVVGVNWQAGLVTARALGVCGGDAFDIMSGAAWMVGADVDNVPAIAAANRVKVVNMSLSGARACTPFEQDVLDWIDGEGAVAVAAAGNEASTVGAPANCNNVVAVGAFGPDGNRASYSNWGPEIDVVGPGGDFTTGDAVYSAVGPGVNAYVAYEGTSMAAPHIAGAISLALALDPNLTRTSVVPLFSQGITCGDCDDVPALQLDLLVEAIVPGSTTPPPPPTPVDDAYEENDAFATATQVGCNMTIEAHAAAQDFDFFALSISSGATLTATLSSATGADLDLYVVKGMAFETDVLVASETETGDESVTHVADTTPIALLVNPFFDSTTNDANVDDYTLHIGCTGNTAPPPTEPTPTPPPSLLVPDALEPNDTKEAPAVVACGADEELTMLGDDDWFAIDVEANTDLSVTTRGLMTRVPVAVYTSDGEHVLAEGEGVALQLRAETPALGEGRYLIHVAPDGGEDNYELFVTCATSESSVESCSHTTTTEGPPSLALVVLAFLALRVRRRRTMGLATRSR